MHFVFMKTNVGRSQHPQNRMKPSLGKRLGAWVTAGVATAILASGVARLAGGKEKAASIQKPRPVATRNTNRIVIANRVLSSERYAPIHQEKVMRQLKQISKIYNISEKSSTGYSILRKASDFCSAHNVSPRDLFLTLEKTTAGTDVPKEIMSATLRQVEKQSGASEADRQAMVWAIHQWRNGLSSTENSFLSKNMLARRNTVPRLKDLD